jgi:hypothetical protein
MSRCFSQLFSIFINSHLIIEELGDLKIGRQTIRIVIYADDLVLLAKENTAVKNMTDKLIEIGRCYVI